MTIDIIANRQAMIKLAVEMAFSTTLLILKFRVKVRVMNHLLVRFFLRLSCICVIH